MGISNSLIWVIRRKREENLLFLSFGYSETHGDNQSTKINYFFFSVLELAKSLVNNTKFYFSGETSQLGALMANILKPNE